jgi:hypothetical protein
LVPWHNISLVDSPSTLHMHQIAYMILNKSYSSSGQRSSTLSIQAYSNLDSFTRLISVGIRNTPINCLPVLTLQLFRAIQLLESSVKILLLLSRNISKLQFRKLDIRLLHNLTVYYILRALHLVTNIRRLHVLRLTILRRYNLASGQDCLHIYIV